MMTEKLCEAMVSDLVTHYGWEAFLDSIVKNLHNVEQPLIYLRGDIKDTLYKLEILRVSK